MDGHLPSQGWSPTFPKNDNYEQVTTAMVNATFALVKNVTTYEEQQLKMEIFCRSGIWQIWFTQLRPGDNCDFDLFPCNNFPGKNSILFWPI